MKELEIEGNDLVKSEGKDVTEEFLFSAVLSLFYTMETYWSYGPDPSMLHFVKWEESLSLCT